MHSLSISRLSAGEYRLEEESDDLRTIRKNNVSPFRSPKHIRWDRQRSDQELLHVATEYGKCWNPQHWHRLTQGYYDGFDDARTEYRRRHDEDLAATKERYRAEIEELKANWIPPDEAEAAIQEIYALRKERDELLESMDLLRKIGFPAMREKKLSERLMGCAKRALNSSIAWTCCGRRPNAGMLRAFVQKARGYLLRFGVGTPKDPLIKSTS
jgi:hypothetical protein